MSLPLQQRAIESDSADLVRLTLVENGAAPALVDALIPMRPLEPGEQYRFHFDMTKCIGCRSCEIACNEQNGNPAEIKWRRVGELEGGTYPNTRRTYLSMGCNHCLSADCLKGCPVDAYSKDPVTGIVLHSADACIGCQYCVWNCPYSVPQFNPERGVVGKCDMCRGRLEEGREPACVNACPENAIQIEIVNKEEWKNDYALAESPGLPPAGQTISTTRVTLPPHSTTWLERVDTGAMPLEHAHPSLIAMTSSMQAIFGAFSVLYLAGRLSAANLIVLFVVTCFALTTSVLHLGRPAYAWRALKMWRRSWLSREVLFFLLFFVAVFLTTAVSFGAASAFKTLAPFVKPFAMMAFVSGLAGTIASAYIYLVRARPAWNTIHTPIDFLLSAALIGVPLAREISGPSTYVAALAHRFGILLPNAIAQPRALVCVGFAALWIANQMVRLLRLRQSTSFERRASYNHLRGESLFWISVLSWIAAVVTPIFLAAPLPLCALITASAAVVLARYLFFVSVVPLSMGLTFLSAAPAHGGAA